MHQNEMKRTFYMDFHMDFQECVWCNEITGDKTSRICTENKHWK